MLTPAFTGSLKISEKRAEVLEAKLDASEKALKEAESRASTADALQAKLEAAEKALKEAEDRAAASEEKLTGMATREAGIMERIITLSDSFGSKSKLSAFLRLLHIF